MFAEALAEIKPKDEDQIVPNLEDAARPLKNVVVFVNKKLVRIQGTLFVHYSNTCQVSFRKVLDHGMPPYTFVQICFHPMIC